MMHIIDRQQPLVADSGQRCFATAQHLMLLHWFCLQTLFVNYAAITSKTFLVTLMVEFIGVMVFAFLGSTVKDPVHGPWVRPVLVLP